ncbi:MAG: DUF4154 domain-containing protein [Sandaracinaceae bacterium]|nr:DUF4154 domain-containing protein [Sandaracinaceae bacterium]
MVLALLVSITSGAGSALAQDASARQAALILRILSYDRNLPERASGEVTILVAFRSSDAESRAESERITAALNAMGRRTTVANMHAHAVAVAFTDADALRAAATRESAAAIYVCQGLGASTRAVSSAARAAHLLSLTGERSGLSQGLSVGLVANGSEVQLVINLPAVEAEGARLDATVLRLAEVIR